MRPASGIVTLESGQQSGDISLQVLPDDKPELDEEFHIQLVNVSGWNEKLRSGATSAVLTVLENDEPRGVFQFAYIAPIQIHEQDSSFEINIHRSRGSYERQFVEVCFRLKGF